MNEVKCPVCGKPLKVHTTYRDGRTDRSGLPDDLFFRDAGGFQCGGHDQPWEFLTFPNGSSWGFIKGIWVKLSFQPRKGKLIGNRLFQQ